MIRVVYMNALVFTNYFEIIIAIAFFAIYVYETIVMYKKVNYENKEDIVIPKKVYYVRLLVNTLSELMLITFVLSVIAHLTTFPASTIQYWYLAGAAWVKVYNKNKFYK